MNIVYLGHSSFLLEFSNGTRIVTDPYDGIGYRMPRTRADFVTCSHFHFDHYYLEGVSGAGRVISAPGSYDCGGVHIEGFAAFHDAVGGKKRGTNTVFVFEDGGLRVCHMGDIGEPPRPDLLKQIGRPDILLIPVGGTYTVDAKGAFEYIDAIRPSVSIAMHYCSAGCTLDIAPASAAFALAKERCVAYPSSRFDSADSGAYEGKVLFMERVCNG